MDVPRSPCRTPQSHDPYWTWMGRSKPSSLRSLSRSASVTAPAPSSPVRIIRAASPGTRKKRTNTSTVVRNIVGMKRPILRTVYAFIAPPVVHISGPLPQGPAVRVMLNPIHRPPERWVWGPQGKSNAYWKSVDGRSIRAEILRIGVPPHVGPSPDGMGVVGRLEVL